jgi:hypothetical protein
MHINDIFKSPLSKPKIEVQAKDLDLNKLRTDEPPKPVSIKIERTIEAANGSKTKYNLTIDHTFKTPKELREILESVDYFGTQSIGHRIKNFFTWIGGILWQKK